MNKLVSMEDIIPIIREQIANDGKVSFTPKGNSMLPLFRNNQDIVTLAKPEFPLKKYSIVLYQRENGKYVLHRLVENKGKYYTMRGDNQYRNEHQIAEKQIIAVVVEFTRNGKLYKTTDRSYKLYSVFWTNTMPVRMVYKIFRYTAGKVKRKILRNK